MAVRARARCGILEGAQKAGEQTLSQTPPNSSCQSSFPFNMPMSTGVVAEGGWPSCVAIEPFRTTARARHEKQSAPIPPSMSIAHSRHLLAFRGHWRSRPPPIQPAKPPQANCCSHEGHNLPPTRDTTTHRQHKPFGRSALPGATLSRQRGIPRHSAGNAAFSMDMCSICMSGPLPSTAFLVCVQRGSVPLATPITSLYTPHHARQTNHKPESARR